MLFKINIIWNGNPKSVCLGKLWQTHTHTHSYYTRSHYITWPRKILYCNNPDKPTAARALFWSQVNSMKNIQVLMVLLIKCSFYCLTFIGTDGSKCWIHVTSWKMCKDKYCKSGFLFLLRTCTESSMNLICCRTRNFTMWRKYMLAIFLLPILKKV